MVRRLTGITGPGDFGAKSAAARRRLEVLQKVGVPTILGTGGRRGCRRSSSAPTKSAAGVKMICHLERQPER